MPVQIESLMVWWSLLSGDVQVLELYILAEGAVDKSSSTECLFVPRSCRISFADTNRIRLLRTHFTPSFRQRWQVAMDSSPDEDVQKFQHNQVEFHRHSHLL